MKVKFFAPSYRRSEKSLTQANYPFVKLVVSESEKKDYEENGNEVVACPDEVQGNLCTVRNWILDNLYEDSDCIVLLDDDISGIYRWVIEEKVEKVKFVGDELMEFAELAALLCRDWGFRMWGVNCIGDKGSYREYTPFGTFQYLGGPFQAFLKENELRYDERFRLKQDYDMTLQQVLHYGGLLRFNMVNFDAKQSEQEGGCATYRNLDEEMRIFKLLQDKWGDGIVRRDFGSKRSFDYNPVLKIPFKGV